MAIRKHGAFIPGEIYHVYNRSVGDMKLFRTKYACARAQKTLFLVNSTETYGPSDTPSKEFWEMSRGEPLVEILAYAFMPNHFHLLLRECTDGGITKFMGRFSTSIAMAWNAGHERTGIVFERTFQSRHVDSDRYLKKLFAYIHLNPISIIQPQWKERGIKYPSAVEHFLKKYSASSLPDYFGEERNESALIAPNLFHSLFANDTHLLRELMEHIPRRNELNDFLGASVENAKA